MDSYSDTDNVDMPGYLARNNVPGFSAINVTGSAGTTDGPIPFGDVELQGTCEPGPLFAGNLQPGPSFAGNLQPGPSFAGNQQPGPLFAGNMQPGPSIGGHMQPSQSFAAGNNMQPGPSFAGNMQPGPSFAGIEPRPLYASNMPRPFPFPYTCKDMISHIKDLLDAASKFENEANYLKARMDGMSMPLEGSGDNEPWPSYEMQNVPIRAGVRGNSEMWALYRRGYRDGRKESRKSLMDRRARSRTTRSTNRASFVTSSSPQVSELGPRRRPNFRNPIPLPPNLSAVCRQLRSIELEPREFPNIATSVHHQARVTGVNPRPTEMPPRFTDVRPRPTGVQPKPAGLPPKFVQPRSMDDGDHRPNGAGRLL